MVSLADYAGREQSYVKHIFLNSYLEVLAHKIASTYSHIAYVDGFAGPWQSASERFEDTSFGIALGALRRARQSWKRNGRDVHMSAHLVEKDQTSYARLTTIPPRYPDLSVQTYSADFVAVLPSLLRRIPSDAFAFFFIDPKGWRFQLGALGTMLARQKSEVIFNFMFDFINRAASIEDPAIISGLDELIPYGDWRQKLIAAENQSGGRLTAEARKEIIVGAFTESLEKLGGYRYVAETTVLRPLKDRPLYCLCYATRHETGIEVFRDCQFKALRQQSITRAAAKLKHAAASSGQGEFFESLHDMGPDELTEFLERERRKAKTTLLQLTPSRPKSISYRNLWPQVLARHVIRRADVNEIAARLRKEGTLDFPGWEKGRRVPQSHYMTRRP
jgi:three-Cys-motif partner protein